MGNLAGKDLSDMMSSDQVILNASLLYDINMGYSGPKSLRPGDSILYHEAECAYQHPWSIESLMEDYEFHRLKEYITLKDYLTMPSFMVDKMLKGLSKGRKRRREEDERLKKEAEDKKKAQKAHGQVAGMDLMGLDPTMVDVLSALDPSKLPDL